MKNKNKKEKRGKDNGMSLQVLPFSEVQDLTISERVKKILNLILNNKIVIMPGRLRAEEEARLIEDTMALVDHIPNFKGIELAVIESDNKEKSLLFKLRQEVARRLTGNSGAITVIGPAAIIKEIKKDPKKIELFLGK